MAAALERVEQSYEHACSAGPDGMANRDRSSINVHAIGRQLELTHARKHLHGEGFIDFEQIDFIERPPTFYNHPPDGFHWRGE